MTQKVEVGDKVRIYQNGEHFLKVGNIVAFQDGKFVINIPGPVFAFVEPEEVAKYEA